jgi:hypothetical protein
MASQRVRRSRPDFERLDSHCPPEHIQQQFSLSLATFDQVPVAEKGEMIAA